MFTDQALSHSLPNADNCGEFPGAPLSIARRALVSSGTFGTAALLLVVLTGSLVTHFAQHVLAPSLEAAVARASIASTTLVPSPVAQHASTQADLSPGPARSVTFSASLTSSKAGRAAATQSASPSHGSGITVVPLHETASAPSREFASTASMAPYNPADPSTWRTRSVGSTPL